jgi:1-phosphatidylinositol phosphodiesterase
MAEAFLRAHPSETLIMCVKEEGDHRPEFSARVYQTFREKEGGALWSFAPDYVPTLGEVRGRGIIFTRFGKEDGAAEWADGMGIHPPSWPDDRREGFTLDGCFRDGVSFRCHDWYGVPNITQVGEKASAVAGFLEPTLEPSSPQPLTMVFNTASTFPGAPPQWISCGFGMTSVGLGLEGTNARLTAWLLSKITEGRRPRATVMLDFYQYNGGESGLAALLVAVNFI